MKTVLVTGAGGLLGRELISLLARDHQVVALARQPIAHENPNVQPFPADLSQPLDLDRLPDRLDAVVYLAQSPRFRDFPGGAADVRQVNTDQPLALIEAARARGAGAFVYASTGSVYAPSASAISEEDAAPANGFYAASKLAAELLLKPYGALMNVALLRFFFIYGRGQKRDMLLPRLVGSVREGRTITLQGQDGLRINPIHVSDAARAVEAALSIDGCNTINIAGPETLSIRDICEIAGERLGQAPQFEMQQGSAGSDLVADISRMRSLLGAPSVRFEDVVKELAEE
jgi:nucleoside-diphosphate-sugar epimerase